MARILVHPGLVHQCPLRAKAVPCPWRPRRSQTPLPPWQRSPPIPVSSSRFLPHRPDSVVWIRPIHPPHENARQTRHLLEKGLEMDHQLLLRHSDPHSRDRIIPPSPSPANRTSAVYGRPQTNLLPPRNQPGHRTTTQVSPQQIRLEIPPMPSVPPD